MTIRRRLEVTFLIGVVILLLTPTIVVSVGAPSPENVHEHETGIARTSHGEASVNALTRPAPGVSNDGARVKFAQPVRSRIGANLFLSAAARVPLTARHPSPDSEGLTAGEFESAAAAVAEEKPSVMWSSGSIESIAQRGRATPQTIRLPSLQITAGIDAVGLDANGAMTIPDADDRVGWYRYGPAPGETGTTAIAGHLDDAEGGSIFYELDRIEPGDVIDVELSDGATIRFEVAGKESFPADRLPADRVFSREGDPILALLTCAGEWDRNAGRYTETMVVFATLQPDA